MPVSTVFVHSVQGQLAVMLFTTMRCETGGISVFKLSSVARLRIVVCPEPCVGVNVYVQLPRPTAGCHVAFVQFGSIAVLQSVDTSTPPTFPGAVSEAVPLTVTCVPAGSVLPAAGEVIVDVGGVESLDLLAAVRFSDVSKDCGCTSAISANRLSNDCWILGSVTVSDVEWSCVASRPHDH